MGNENIETHSSSYAIFKYSKQVGHLLLQDLVAPKGAVVGIKAGSSLLAAGVLGDGLGALADSVFSQLTRQKETNSCLDLPRGDCGFLVVVSQAGSLASDTLEDIVNEGVHDAHGLAGDTSVGMDLLHDLVDVDGVAFLPPPVPLLLVSAGLLGALLSSFRCNFGRHDLRIA